VRVIFYNFLLYFVSSVYILIFSLIEVKIYHFLLNLILNIMLLARVFLKENFKKLLSNEKKPKIENELFD